MTASLTRFKPVLTDPVALAVSIMPQTRAEFPQWLALVLEARPAVVEWRLDYLLTGIDPLKPTFPIYWQQILTEARTYFAGWPLLLTYRTKAQGGQGTYTALQYASLLKVLCQQPGTAKWLDIEATLPLASQVEILNLAQQAGLTTILSWHDFGPAKGALAWYQQLHRLDQSQADYLKLAVMTARVAEAEELLETTRLAQAKGQHPLVTMAMGEAGQISRIEGYRYGSELTFAALKPSIGPSAPGQLTVAALRRVWAK